MGTVVKERPAARRAGRREVVLIGFGVSWSFVVELRSNIEHCKCKRERKGAFFSEMCFAAMFEVPRDRSGKSKCLPGESVGVYEIVKFRWVFGDRDGGVREGDGEDTAGKEVDREPGTGLLADREPVSLGCRVEMRVGLVYSLNGSVKHTSSSAGSTLSVSAERIISGIASESFHNPSLLSPTI